MSSCGNCGSTGKLLRCGRCGCVSYCSRECQLDAWSTHKDECSPLLKPLAGVNWSYADFDRIGALDLFERETAAKTGQRGTYSFNGTTADLVEMLKGEDCVNTDCMLFAVLVATINGRIDESCPLVFQMGGDPEIGFTGTTIKPFYISPNQRLYTMLAGKTSDVGQWVLPTGKGKYLGMSSKGPRVLTPSAWHKRLVKGVIQDLPEVAPIENILLALKSYYLWPDGLVGHPDGICLTQLK